MYLFAICLHFYYLQKNKNNQLCAFREKNSFVPLEETCASLLSQFASLSFFAKSISFLRCEIVVVSLRLLNSDSLTDFSFFDVYQICEIRQMFKVTTISRVEHACICTFCTEYSY